MPIAIHIARVSNTSLATNRTTPERNDRIRDDGVARGRQSFLLGVGSSRVTNRISRADG